MSSHVLFSLKAILESRDDALERRQLKLSYLMCDGGRHLRNRSYKSGAMALRNHQCDQPNLWRYARVFGIDGRGAHSSIALSNYDEYGFTFLMA